MTARLTDIVARYIESAIEVLDLPQAVKDQVEYEILTYLTPAQSGLITGGPPSLTVGWMIGIGLPTKAGDHLMPFLPLDDPHSMHEIHTVVESLLGQVQQEVAQADLQVNSVLNGHRATPGGLVLPK